MKRGLIPEQIAFASSIDVSKCNSVQQFIMEKANQESYIRYACGYEERALLPVEETPPEPVPFLRRFTFVIP